MNMLYFGAGFARPLFGCIFPNFCGVIQFYEIKLEVEVDFCMFLVVYMFSKQIWYWNRIGRQLLEGFELADELADSLNPVRLLAFERLINTLNRISQKGRKKNAKAWFPYSCFCRICRFCRVKLAPCSANTTHTTVKYFWFPYCCICRICCFCCRNSGRTKCIPGHIFVVSVV